jgi:hypothetical protein
MINVSMPPLPFQRGDGHPTKTAVGNVEEQSSLLFGRHDIISEGVIATIK